MEDGHVVVDEAGYCRFPTVRFPPRWGSRRGLWIFTRNSKSDPDATVHIWWELFTQTMAVMDLITEYRWSPSALGIDIDSDTFDVGAYGDEAATELVIAGEAKPTERRVSNLLRQMAACAEARCSPERPHHPDRPELRQHR